MPRALVPRPSAAARRGTPTGQQQASKPRRQGAKPTAGKAGSKPAGKQVKRLSLLSGGERSLVAVAFLVALFMARPQEMPADWQLEGAPPERMARRVADYIAGMTDRYALDQHARFFDTTPELR